MGSTGIINSKPPSLMSPQPTISTAALPEPGLCNQIRFVGLHAPLPFFGVANSKGSHYTIIFYLVRKTCKMRKLIFLFGSCVALLLASKPLAVAQMPHAKLLDEFAQQALPLWQTTGMAMAVVKNGETVFKKGYGVTDIRTQKPFTTQTIAFCASTTKAMTAACLAMLVDDGLLKWDDKLKKVLPGFRLYDPYVSDEITVKDLLTHNTGLGNGDLLWLFGYNADSILQRMQFMKPAYSLRSSFIYQNLMYVVAGEVIKKVSGKPWKTVIRQRIFEPLGMRNTYAHFKDAAKEPSLMTPHYNYGDTLIQPIANIDFGEYDPAGSVVSNIDDITKWMQFLQDSAMINGKRLISAENFSALFKPQAIIPANEFYPTAKFTQPHWTTYGLGWFQQDYRGKMIQFHTGSLDGSIAIFGFVPDEKMSFYFFGNLDHSEIRHALMWKAIDLWCFNDNSKDWSTLLYHMYKGFSDSAASREKAKFAPLKTTSPPSLPLVDYTGTYQHPVYGLATVALKNGLLSIQFPNQFGIALTHWQHNTFKGQYSYDWFGKTLLRFELNTAGAVSKFEWDGFEYERL
jgi:CubicO group peptidase (beta-lactamase class C family)